MTVLSTVFFACLGLVAMTTMLATARRYVPFFGELRRSLRDAPESVELRLRVKDLAVVPVLARARRRRRLSSQKPIRHRLHRHGAHRATA
jgi:hypothetical protein